MSFAWHLQSILKELQIKDIDRSRYTSCADEIRNYLMNALQKTDHDFKDAFDGHSLTGSYLDGVKLKTPDEFDIHIKLKFPFPLKPIKDNNHAGFVLLQTSYGGYHPLIENNYLNHDRMQTWLRGAFTKVLKGECRSIQVQNECFILEYQNQGYGCAHTIVATSRARQISFDFVPALAFSYEYWPLATPPVTKEVRRAWPWFAIPQSKKPHDNRTFMVCAPHWEREMMKGKYNLKNILRLMKAVRDVHKDELPHLSSYMLKTVILLELNNADSQLWQEDVGKTIISMWSKLQHYFNKANLPFFLASDCNHFDRMSPREFNTCRKKVDELLTQLTYVSNNPFTDQRVRQLFLD